MHSTIHKQTLPCERKGWRKIDRVGNWIDKSVESGRKYENRNGRENECAMNILVCKSFFDAKHFP